MSASSFEDADSAELIDELRRLERAATVRAQGYWFVLIVFGLITMFSGRIDGDWIGLYWTVAIPFGVAVSMVWYQWRDVPAVRSSWWWYVVVAMWMIVGTNVVDELMTGQAGYVAAYSVVGVGLLGYAVLERSAVMAVVAVATPTVAVLVSLIDKAEPPALPSAVGFMWFIVGVTVGALRQ